MAEDSLGAELHTVEHEQAVADPVRLSLASHAHAGVIRFDEEHGRSLTGGRGDEDEIGDGAESHGGLLAVEHPAIAQGNGARRRRSDIEVEILDEGGGEDLLTQRGGLRPGSLLLGGTELGDGHGTHDDRGKKGHRRQGATRLDQHPALLDQAIAAAANVLR